MVHQPLWSVYQQSFKGRGHAALWILPLSLFCHILCFISYKLTKFDKKKFLLLFGTCFYAGGSVLREVFRFSQAASASGLFCFSWGALIKLGNASHRRLLASKIYYLVVCYGFCHDNSGNAD